MNRRALVTGGGRGLGAALADELTRRGYDVDVTCRRPVPATHRGGHPTPTVHKLDLASFADIRRFTADRSSEGCRYDLIVNNAGVCQWQHERTDDGHEVTLATNYLGPFLLTRLLLDDSDRTAPLGVINIGSSRMLTAWGDDALTEASDYDMARAYAASKTLLAAFTAELRRRSPPLAARAMCIHPGLLRTRLGGDGALARLGRALSWPFAASAAAGARKVLGLFHTESGNSQSDGLFLTRYPTSLPASIADARTRQALWDRTSDLVGLPRQSPANFRSLPRG